MSFPVTVGLNYGEEKITTATKRRALGTRGVTPDGRVYYYARNGAVALTRGMVLQTAATLGASVHVQNLVPHGAPAVGAITVDVAVVTTPAPADVYADGYLTIETSPGQGIYKIKSHPTIASGATGTFTLYEPLVEALTSGASKVGLQANPFASVVAFPTTQIGACVGVAPNNVAISDYFWTQTFGPAVVKLDAVVAQAGRTVMVPGASAGNATPTTTVAEMIPQQVIGVTPTVGQGDEDFNYIFLSIRA